MINETVHLPNVFDIVLNSYIAVRSHFEILSHLWQDSASDVFIGGHDIQRGVLRHLQVDWCFGLATIS